MLGCKFCPFVVPFVRKLKDGRLRMGRDTLTWHVREKHTAEYYKILAFIRATSSLIPDQPDEGTL